MKILTHLASTFIPTLAICFLCACSKSPEPTSTPLPDANEKSAHETSVATTDARLPPGVALDIAAYRIKSSSTSGPKNGKIRHHTVLEVMLADSEQAVEQVSAAFTKAGYSGNKLKPLKEGRLRRIFSKPKTTTASVVFYPSAGNKPSSPTVKGRVTITWTVPAEG